MEKILKALHVQHVSLWPRFEKSVKADLDGVAGRCQVRRYRGLGWRPHGALQLVATGATVRVFGPLLNPCMWVSQEPSVGLGSAGLLVDIAIP